MGSYHTSELTAHLTTPEKKEANTFRKSRREKIIQMRPEISKKEARKTIERIKLKMI